MMAPPLIAVETWIRRFKSLAWWRLRPRQAKLRSMRALTSVTKTVSVAPQLRW